MTFSICLHFNLSVLSYFRLINRLQIISKIQSSNVNLNLAHAHLLHLLIYLDYFYCFLYFLLELPVLFLFLTIFISCFFPSTSLEVRLSISMIFMASLGILTDSVQFSSVAQSCPTICNPMNCSTPGLPVHHHFPEFTQTHVHRVRDAIQPSHPLSSPSPPASNPSQHQSLFQWVNSSHEVAKLLEFQL